MNIDYLALNLINLLRKSANGLSTFRVTWQGASVKRHSYDLVRHGNNDLMIEANRIDAKLNLADEKRQPALPVTSLTHLPIGNPTTSKKTRLRAYGSCQMFLTPLFSKHLGFRYPGLLATASAVVCLVVVSFPNASIAQWLRESGAAMSAAGIGDAARSTAYGQAALVFNPAGISQVPVYELQTGYAYTNLIEGHALSASIVDSATNEIVSAGVGYAFAHRQLTSDLTFQTHQLRGALASGYRGETLSVFGGAGIRWLRQSPEEGDADDYLTMDVGALLVLSNLVRIGIVGQNLIPSDRGAGLPTTIGTGLAATYGGFLVAFDTAIDLDTNDEVSVQYNFGLQYTVLDMLPLRLGFQLDKIVEDKRMTAGLGYWSPLLAVDIGYQHSLDNTDSFLVGLDLRIMIP